jgi:hypothetical protein
MPTLGRQNAPCCELRRFQPGAGKRPNNGMHPTADTRVLKFSKGAARRVMRGVRLLMRSEITAG